MSKNKSAADEVTEVSTVDELHEEVYGKPDTAPNAPYVDNDDSDEYQTPPATPPAAPPAAPPADDFKHKYDVLQGKYNAEIGRMNKMLSDVYTEKEQLAAQLNQSAAPANPYTDDAQVDETTSSIEFLKAQYPDAYPGIEALIAKRSVEVLKPVADNMAKVAAEIKGDKYTKDLDSRLPNWRQVNADPDFGAWLDVPDRYTGATRRQILRDAYNKGDSERTLAFFEDYVTIRQGGQPPPSPPPQSPPQQRADIDTYPSTSGSPTPSTQEKGIVNKADIDRFYRDRAQGRFIGSEEDAARVESRFFRAIKEGKVR